MLRRIARSSAAANDRGVIPLKRKEALGWADSKALDSDKIEEMFGKVAEAGDQTGAILLRVPQTLKSPSRSPRP